MIPLTRIRTAPPVHAHFFGAKRISINLKLLKQKRDGKLDAEGEKKWDSSFWKESKEQLLVETNDKCAYCETPIKVVQYGDVEHFRPKSVYWWLAYSYENYLASCAICNQKYKKDFFQLTDDTLRIAGPVVDGLTDAQLKTLARTLTVDPVDNATGKDLQELMSELQAEKALLINPYFDDPVISLAYRPILENKEVLVVPTAPGFKPIVDAGEQLFGINRQELRDFRFQWYCFYMTCRHTLQDGGISANTKAMNRARLTQMNSARSAYAGMVRYFESIPLDELPWDFNIQIDL